MCPNKYSFLVITEYFVADTEKLKVLTEYFRVGTVSLILDAEYSIAAVMSENAWKVSNY